MIDADATVVIACHTAERWDALLRAIASAHDQRPRPAAVIVAVDHNPALSARLRAAGTGAVVVDATGERGASATRNAGARAATTECVAFLDDDAAARAGWLSALLAPLRRDRAVLGTGGAVEPIWATARPSWFPDELGWVVGAAHAGLPDATAPVRNVWSENMAVRRAELDAVGGFREGFGKVGSASQPEDTDLCMRMAAAHPGRPWLYVPGAIVGHEVPAERATFGFFLRRSYSEGRGKVRLARDHAGGGDFGPERRYLRHTVPLAMVRHVREGHPAQAAAIGSGTAAAALGGTLGLLRRGG